MVKIERGGREEEEEGGGGKAIWGSSFVRAYLEPWNGRETAHGPNLNVLTRTEHLVGS